MINDLHLHTIASDGRMTVEELLSTASRLGLKRISITDHDSLGAYHNQGPGSFEKASSLGITLISGIELDSTYEDCEIHVLGYGMQIDHPAMTSYLKPLQQMRKAKMSAQLKEIRRRFPDHSFPDSEIWCPGRETFMKPHLVHLLLKNNLFTDYKEAASWMNREISVDIEVPKQPTADMVSLVKKAGGMAVLAHPAFYEREKGIDLDRMIRELLPAGLDGIEILYPYRGTGPAFSLDIEEQAAWRRMMKLAMKYSLAGTFGSDAHSTLQMDEIHRDSRFSFPVSPIIAWM